MGARVGAVAAVDIGTTAVKGVVLDSTGTLIAAHEVPLETRRPAAGWVEQDPGAWWAALVDVCAAWRAQGIALDTLAALSLSGQMQDVALTRAGVPTSPALLYSDGRAGAEAAEVAALLGVDPATATGNPYGETSVLPKLRWLARHVPGALEGGDNSRRGKRTAFKSMATGAALASEALSAGVFARSLPSPGQARRSYPRPPRR